MFSVVGWRIGIDRQRSIDDREMNAMRMSINKQWQDDLLSRDLAYFDTRTGKFHVKDLSAIKTEIQNPCIAKHIPAVSAPEKSP